MPQTDYRALSGKFKFQSGSGVLRAKAALGVHPLGCRSPSHLRSPVRRNFSHPKRWIGSFVKQSVRLSRWRSAPNFSGAFPSLTGGPANYHRKTGPPDPFSKTARCFSLRKPSHVFGAWCFRTPCGQAPFGICFHPALTRDTTAGSPRR